MTSQITKDSNGIGTVKWSFSEADDDFDFLSKNQVIVLTYGVTVSDNHGGTAKQTVTITVTGTDDKPVIATSVAATVCERALAILKAVVPADTETGATCSLASGGRTTASPSA